MSTKTKQNPLKSASGQGICCRGLFGTCSGHGEQWSPEGRGARGSGDRAPEMKHDYICHSEDKIFLFPDGFGTLWARLTRNIKLRSISCSISLAGMMAALQHCYDGGEANVTAQTRPRASRPDNTCYHERWGPTAMWPTTSPYETVRICLVRGSIYRMFWVTDLTGL